MTLPVVKGASYILVHTPTTLFHYGSTQTQTRLKDPDAEYLKKIPEFLRSFDDCVAYAPNQVFIGNILPDELNNIPQPWYENPVSNASRFGEMGEIMPEDEFFGLVKLYDSFDLVKLTKEFTAEVKSKLESHPIFSKKDLKGLGDGVELSEIEELVNKHVAEGLYLGEKLVGCIKQAHDTDPNLNAHVMLENLMTKASGILALLNLEKQGFDLSEIEYVIEASEEACGDINQRGGGNFAKAMAEMAGCVNATGSDTRSFCAAPAHALVNAAALVKAGVYKTVAVIAGGAVAKLGMNGKDHVAKNIPLLEDCLGGFAILVTANDGESPIIRTDLVGRHTVGTGSSPQAVITALVTNPLDKGGLKITDIDKYSVEMQNPEITKPAGAGNVPEANYKMIAALGVKRGDLERTEIPEFVKKHGMPGFAPTQGHIPSGVPFVGPAMKMMKAGQIEKVMIIGKGSLFLGRMTNLFDGVSFVMEKNTGVVEETVASEDDVKLKKMVADAMRELAQILLKEEK
ncbi:glycine reductase [Anoxybacter fermentans]|uniref:Glycine reductase n=1 Tax=Anoxybacter fermentans TaxID=1323375 RepID=A0A3Q9HQ45_9FIRM|nr:glycine/sarcosine/betaine reductase complex component C subunit beta [Anoxybacter fermentans]AZR72874.1 glycine reductase [Anoxybacter fermentans]